MTLNRIWTLGAIILIIAVLVLAWIAGVSPKLAEAQGDAQQQQSVEQNNQSQTAQLAALKGQYSSLAALEAKLALLQISIPGDSDATLFVELLDYYSTSSGATVTSVTITAPAAPAAVVPASTATATPTPAATAAAPGFAVGGASSSSVAAPSGLETFTVSINATGSIKSVLALDADLQNYGRLFLVSNFTISTASSGTSGVIDGSIYAIPDPEGLPTGIPTVTPTSLPKAGATPAPTNTAVPTDTPTPSGTTKP